MNRPTLESTAFCIAISYTVVFYVLQCSIVGASQRVENKLCRLQHFLRVFAHYLEYAVIFITIPTGKHGPAADEISRLPHSLTLKVEQYLAILLQSVYIK